MKLRLMLCAATLLAIPAAISVCAQSAGQAPKAELSDDALARYQADVFRPWESRCMEKGCILSLDVLRGVSEDPPDAKDAHEYISIAVAIDRKDRTPEFFMFEMPPYAQKDQGVFIAFARHGEKGSESKLIMDSDGASRLLFKSCDSDTCKAVVPGGKVAAGQDTHEMDLLDKFLHSTHLMLLYMSKGHAYRTMVLLSRFQEEYQRVLREELKPAP